MKYLKNLRYISFLAALLMVSGCDSELDELRPNDRIPAEDIYNSGEKLEKLLNGAYDIMGRGNLFGGDILRDSELLGSDGALIFSGTYNAPAEIWLKDMVSDNADVTDRWANSYLVINSANILLDKIALIDEADQDRIKGEALFLRGLTYFELAKFYGKPYSAGNTAQNLAVPLITSPVYDAGDITYPERESVEAVYQQAIADLQEAENLLPATNGIYANKVAAAAVLARIYLQTAEYEKARDAANRGLEAAAGSYELKQNYEEAFNNSSNSAEDVFAVQVSTQDGSNNMQLYFASSLLGGRGDVEIQNQHLNLYAENDARLMLFYEDEATGDTRTGKWKNQFANVPVIRLAELYLIRAEANARLGTELGATPAEDLNLIRLRAGLEPIESPTLEQILAERVLELAFEGQRVHDLKRLKQSIDGLDFDSPKLVFPIPQRERNVNTNLEQNSGY